MGRRKRGFTLIELIIIVVVIGILALIAIPRYFTSVNKAQKIQAWAGLNEIRRAERAYYSVNGVYSTDNTWPITVIIEGETILSMNNPSTPIWTYRYTSSTYKESYADHATITNCSWHVSFDNNNKPDNNDHPSCPQ